MTTAVPYGTSRTQVLRAVSLATTLVMGVLYTVLDVLQPPQPAFALLAFAPGAISLLFLRSAGLSRPELYLRPAKISLPGLSVLVVMVLLLIPILGSSTTWVGWQWLPALVYAPALGIAQELYFRSSLLPGLEKVFNRRKTLALLVHSTIFVGFHFRTFLSIPSLPIILLVAAVLYLGGCGWGWQVQRDRTAVWAMLQHSLFLMLMSGFGWG